MPTIDERARHELFQAVQDHLGPHHTDTLMSLLPPVGWADVATKHDILEADARLAIRFESIDRRFDAVDRRLDAIDRRFVEVDRRFVEIDRRFEVIDRRFVTLEERVDEKLEALGHRITAEVHRAHTELTRTFMLTLVGSMATMTSLLLGALAFAT
ncbi:MAG TPA: hypothetical protein VF743_06965 [Acidimicrobiales bacterium]